MDGTQPTTAPEKRTKAYPVSKERQDWAAEREAWDKLRVQLEAKVRRLPNVVVLTAGIAGAIGFCLGAWVL